MRIKTLMLTVSLALFFPATAQIARAQKDGEAQVVSFDENNWPTLKFSNKRDKPACGLFISYSLTDSQEESFVIRVAHMHRRALWGKYNFPEEGWLHITPSRIIFIVEKGDKSHAFDVPRTDLEDKPGTRFRLDYVGIQINLRERLPASESREQKFVPFIIEDRKCRVDNQKPYSQFLERTVNDFNGAMAEFKQIAAALKQSGKIQQAPAFVVPPTRFGQAPDDQVARPNVGVGLGVPGNAGVDIVSEPDRAEIYADGNLIGITPARMPLSVGEHTIKVTKPGYQDWERKIKVERGSVKNYNVVLEKQ
jgi:hypothetical protein